jgi:ATP-dependent DNA ligase
MTEPLDIHILDILYGKSKDNKIKSWKISVERYTEYSEIVTLYGYNSKIETRRKVSCGKNLNKANATTHYQQGILEAISKWTKKKDIEQYAPIKLDEPNETGTLNLENLNLNINDTNLICLPMLAQDFQKQKKKVIYPAFCQGKLDGMRMLYNTTTKQITTRQGKEYSIVKESGKLYEELQTLPTGLILDGELYTNKLNFETLGVLRKTKKLTIEELDNLQKIEYHIYDIIDTKLIFKERNKKIKDILYPNKYEKLIYVDTFLVKNEQEIKNYHTKFLEEGLEGTMIRNKDSLYKKKCRSSDLLKYKDFQDDEFKIIDYTLEKDTSGADENLIIWIIKINDNIQCKVRPKGSKEERKELYKKCVENFDQFKGRNLWTKFFCRTADGNLRFPCTFRSTYTEYIRDEIL